MRLRGLVPGLTGLALGAGYGLLCRLTFDSKPRSEGVQAAFTGVSLAFLLVVPFALGILTAAQAPRRQGPSWAYWVLMPLASSTLLLLATLALAWEGAICLVMAAPIVLAGAMLGGLAYGLVAVYWRRGAQPGVVAGCLLLPFAFAPIEARFDRPDGLRVVTTTVLIAAPPTDVWRQVVRVPLIGPQERRDGLFQAIGIPRPLEATLSHDGLGGLREARFEGGIRFHERVTEWEPARRLGFTIQVDPESVSAAVLDEHVRVGGPLFDVVYGRFELQAVPEGTRLLLFSRHRLRTTLNFYAGFWTDAVMQDIQTGICDVIRARSEVAARTDGLTVASDRTAFVARLETRTTCCSSTGRPRAGLHGATLECMEGPERDQVWTAWERSSTRLAGEVLPRQAPERRVADSYVNRRLVRLLRHVRGWRRRPFALRDWSPARFAADFKLHRLVGTIRYPGLVNAS